ncbi:MAG: UDP-2,3-diacylglucosamine diphosphatase [Flavobacteriales bacterium]|nr:UDP-2,3-diacylglucosamine diphosphatase [Flavobacteriales bacterium]
MEARNKYYFASDFHLGIPDAARSREREKALVRWLEQVRHDAHSIFLMGDLFDFWFEYKYVVPKGYVRLLGKLAELRDSGIEIVCFRGNHDMWMFGYFESELGIPVISNEYILMVGDKKFYLHHGDGLGPGDRSYKMLKRIFRNTLCQWLFSILPPRWGFGLANFFSSRSRLANASYDEQFTGENEWLWQYAKEMEKREHFDYYIFGHRHLPLDLEVNERSRYYNLGEWLHHRTYGVFDGEKFELKTFEA